MAALHYLAPNFIQEGRLCWLRSPLWIVKSGKKESYYYDDEEFNKVRPKIRGDIKRAKGLGELNSTQARNSMFSAEFQRMDTIEPNAEAFALLEDLMGSEVDSRKDFVFNNINFQEIRE